MPETTYTLTIDVPAGRGPQGHPNYREETIVASQADGEDLAAAFDRAAIAAGHNLYMARRWEVAP